MTNEIRTKLGQVSEEDLENLAGAFGPGAGSPWARIVQDADPATREQWARNLSSRHVPTIQEEDLEELGRCMRAAPDSPWARIVDLAPSDWKEKWRTKLDEKYGSKD